MLNDIHKAIEHKESIEMIYQAENGEISKRKIKVLKVNKSTFEAYCYLRPARRTFKLDHVLALIPFIQKESMVV